MANTELVTLVKHNLDCIAECLQDLPSKKKQNNLILPQHYDKTNSDGNSTLLPQPHLIPFCPANIYVGVLWKVVVGADNLSVLQPGFSRVFHVLVFGAACPALAGEWQPLTKPCSLSLCCHGTEPLHQQPQTNRTQKNKTQTIPN